ncbi:ARM repeat-containing protein [Imleria badia]|nr:ARM repeat-containing protein [Imleria badia]
MAHAVHHPPHTPQPPSSPTHQPSGSISTSSPPHTPPTTTVPLVRALNTNASTLSSLAMARYIERLQDIEYPEGVRGPREDLNKDTKDGKFRYDRDFLMQFMQLCKEKPLNLPRLDILGIEPLDQSASSMTRLGLGRHRQPASAIPQAARQTSVGLGITSSFGTKPGAAPSPFSMGQFATQTSKLTSEERFMISTGARSASVSGGPAALPFGRSPMTQTVSQGGTGAHPAGGKCARSKRGDRRTDANKIAYYQQGSLEGSGFGGPSAVPVFGAALESVSPLEMSSTVPELVDRKVRALLNKLTMEKFDSISDQIIAWANKSEKEKDGRTLIEVIRLVFEKATDDAAWSEMYARLFRKMMDKISPKVQDDGMRNSEGKPIFGYQLFRKYLLNRCQEDFERSWVAKETTAAAAAAKASDDQAIKAANERRGDESGLYSDEYYAAQKARRQGLGLIKFFGELFKLQMLTERIMHECVKKFLGNVENPKDDEIESLCQLLKTVGQLLDVPKARAHMDVYFTRMKELSKSLNVSPRMQFMLQDVIELRDRKWVARGAVIALTTISAVHEAVAKEKAAADAQRLRMSRGGSSRRGGDQNAESAPDGWTTAGGLVTRPQPKAGDLSRFCDISKGPSSVFIKKNKHDSLSRTSPSSGTPSVLSQDPKPVADTTTKPSLPPSRKIPTDLGQGRAPEPPQRRKLKLLPRAKRSKPIPAEEMPPASEVPIQMSEAEAKKKIEEDTNEFFAVRSMYEADVYFTNLPEEHRFLLVDKLVGSALESKVADAVLVSDFFAQAASKGQCSIEIFEAGFMSMAEFLDDISIGAPNAFEFMAIMLKGAGFGEDQQRLARLAGKSMDGDKLLQLVS